jgi:DNA-binding response OmpR family regulator
MAKKGSPRLKILLVDDDADGRRVARSLLESTGFIVFEASGAREAWDLASEKPPDLVVSDVAMPGTDGVELCRKLKAGRRTAAIPVILMSAARTEEAEQAEGIDSGADAYLPKPFSNELLLAKVKSVLRRSGVSEAPGTVLWNGPLELDLESRVVRVKGRPVHLTRKQFDLLSMFLRKPGRVLSPAFLIETIWGYDTADYDGAHTLQTHVSALRRKLGPAWSRRLSTVSGLGYRFEVS